MPTRILVTILMTITTLAQAEPLVLMSYVKPVLALLLIGGWAWLAAKVDKDAGYFYLQRYLVNLGQIVCAGLGLLALLFIPYFILGFIICLLLMAGSIAGYVFYRNSQVPEEAKWTFSLDSFTQRYDQMQRDSAQRRAAVTLLNKDESSREVPSGNDPQAEAHAQFETLMDWALPRGAEEVEIQVSTEKASIVARVDGVPYPQNEIEPKPALQLVDYLKASAGLDPKERRKRQRGELVFRAGEDRHMAEVISLGSSKGLSLTLRLDAEQATNRKPADLGMLKTQVEQVQTLVQTPHRVVLIAGPKRHGVRSTVLSLIGSHDPYMQNIVTLEMEKRFELEGVDHNYVDVNVSPQEFNQELASLIRTDPAAISLSALPDASTAKLVADAAEDVRFYLPVRADGGFAALKSYARLVGDAKLAANSLGGIISQRLVRKLCMTCRSPYTPDPAALKKMNLPADRVDKLYKASGKVKVKDHLQTCPACGGLGYRGRTGVFEVMVFDDEGRAMVAKNEGERLRSHLRKNGTLWLQEAALEKVVQGVTDIKEVTRVLAEKSS